MAPVKEVYPSKDFQWTPAKIPHTLRRKLITEKHPEIEKLNGHEPLQGVQCLILIVVNLYLAYLARNWSWWSIVGWAYVVGATINHNLFAAMHELSHLCFWPERWMNIANAIAVNIPMGLPTAIDFWRYHHDHHVFFGVDQLDPDIPSEMEARLFDTVIGKLIWVILIPVFYGLRPLIRNPKPVNALIVINWVVILTTDFSLLYFWGLKSLAYCLLSMLFTMNIHPFAGHFIAEHYQFPEGEAYQESYSYYGWMNLLTYNLGHHNEHHDYPSIPGSRLPLLRKMAPEFYDLPTHESWTGPMLRFIFDNRVNCFSRVKRPSAEGGKVADDKTARVLHEGDSPTNEYWCGKDAAQLLAATAPAS